MPTPAYVTIEGVQQGAITSGNFTAESVGNVWQEAHQDEALVEAFEHEITIPNDPQSGQPTGQRVHGPFKFTKIYDKCSPLLENALCSGERLTKVEFKWYRTNMEGQQEHYFTHLFEDAVMVLGKSYMYNCQDPTKSSFTHLEEWWCTYRKVTWTHEVSGTSGSDDWREPIGA
jgi:type VI secretion system secreted protein Hcp